MNELCELTKSKAPNKFEFMKKFELEGEFFSPYISTSRNRPKTNERNQKIMIKCIILGSMDTRISIQNNCIF